MHPWEQEYQSPKFLSLDTEPQKSVRKFVRFLKKDGFEIDGSTTLDLGCGNGRNSLYLAELGSTVTGYDIAPTAIMQAKRLAKQTQQRATFAVHNIGTPVPLNDASIDIVLDVTASNGLIPEERQTYLQELARVVKPGGYLFVRTLCLDGDANAKYLLNQHHGPYEQTYTMPQTAITERVFTKKELETLYAPAFTLRSIKKTSGYMTVDNRRYKRYVWLAYFQKQ